MSGTLIRVFGHFSPTCKNAGFANTNPPLVAGSEQAGQLRLGVALPRLLQRGRLQLGVGEGHIRGQEGAVPSQVFIVL